MFVEPEGFADPMNHPRSSADYVAEIEKVRERLDPGPKWSSEELANMQSHVSPEAYHSLADRQDLVRRTREMNAVIDAQDELIKKQSEAMERLGQMIQGVADRSPGQLPMPATQTRPPTGTTMRVSSSKSGSVRRWSVTTSRGWWTGAAACLSYLIYSIQAAINHPWDPNAPGYCTYWNVPWVVGGPIAAIALAILVVAGRPIRKTEGPRPQAVRETAMVEPEPSPDPPGKQPPPGSKYVVDHYEGLFTPEVFEPYSVCPACGTEGLHWMRTPYEDEGTGENTKTSRYWRENIKDPKRLSSFGVIRTCRNDDCGVSWGQSTPIDKQMSKEAVLVPKTDLPDQPLGVFNPAVVTEETLQDKADVLATIQQDRLEEHLNQAVDDEESGWTVLGNVVKREGSSVPAPVNSRIDPVEQWADAFMDGVAPERTYAEELALDATDPRPPSSRQLPPGVTPGSEHLYSVPPTANTLATKQTGGELTQADAQPKIGKDAVADYRAKGGKMHIVGPGGLVMAAKDPETGTWGVPKRRTTMLRSERDTGPALPTSATKAIEGEIVDVEEVPLPEDER